MNFKHWAAVAATRGYETSLSATNSNLDKILQDHLRFWPHNMELVLGFSVSKILDWQIETLIATLKVDDPMIYLPREILKVWPKKLLGLVNLRIQLKPKFEPCAKPNPCYSFISES